MTAYRNEAEDVFVAILQAFLEFRENKGEEYFFRIIYGLLDKDLIVNDQPEHFLKQPKVELEYILDVEVAFQIIHCTIDLFIFSKSNPYINQIFQFIIAWNLPQHRLIILSSMQFMNDAALELKYSPSLLDGSIQFLLRYIQDPDLGRFAVQTLEGIIEQFEKHNFVNSFKLVAQFMIEQFGVI